MLYCPPFPHRRSDIRLVLTCAAAGFFAIQPAAAADNVWTGAVSSDYNHAGNWSLGRVPDIAHGDNLDVRSTPANVTTISANAAHQVVDIRVGENNATGTVGTVLHTAGIVSSGNGNWTAIGAGNDGAGSFATGIYNLTSTTPSGGSVTGFTQGTGTLNANARLYVGGTDDGNYGTGGTGTLNINTSGAVNIRDELLLGTRGGTGYVNLDNGTVGGNGRLLVGNATGGTGHLRIAGGSLSSGEVNIGSTGGTGTLVMTGGTFNASGEFRVGNENGSTGSLQISAGVINTNTWLGVGRDGSNGVMTISGSAVVNQGVSDAGSRFEMTSDAKPTNSTVNLDGGELSVNGIVNNGGAGAGNTQFNFNGGLLKARIDNGGFMAGLSAATVRAGGARIDTGTFNINIGQQLTGTTGDGGLTKTGAGTLELGASNTFNGPTIINEGTLKLNHGSSPGTLAGDGAIFINNGGTLSSAAVDGTGYHNHTANNAINIAEGGTLRTLEGGRLSMDRIINSVGGTITSTGSTFNSDASFNFRGFAADDFNSYNFTSSPGGTPSTISATNIGVDNATFNVTLGGGPVDLQVTGNLKDTFGTGGIGKSGDGVMVVSHPANDYTGPTNISGGVFEIAGAGALTATDSINVNGGTFLLTGSAGNRVNDTASVNLNTQSAVIPAMKFEAAAGTSITETMGTLSLLAGTTARMTTLSLEEGTTVIDMGNALDAGNAGVRLTFAGTGIWSGSLQIWNWTGTEGVNGGVDQLNGFGGSSLSPSELAGIQFYSGANGTSPVGLGAVIVNGELVPAAVPEPSTLLACLLGLLPLSRRRRK